MLKSVEIQRGELMKIKDGFDAELIELTERVKKTSMEKEAMKEACQGLQKELTKLP